MNRREWAACLPFIQAFVEGKPLQVLTGNVWQDINPNDNDDFDFSSPSYWRLKGPAKLQPRQNENGFNINLLFDAVHKMQAQIGELQLQVQKLETGKRDDEPVELSDGAKLEQQADELVRMYLNDPQFGVPGDYRQAYGFWIEQGQPLDLAWGLLANAWNNGNWDLAPAGWIGAARAWERAWQALEKSVHHQPKHFRQVFTTAEVDERVRRATDVLKQDVIELQKQVDKTSDYIRKAYAQEFEIDDRSPTEDLLRHFFTKQAEQNTKIRKQKALLGRALSMLDPGGPVDPNIRRQLINELAQV